MATTFGSSTASAPPLQVSGQGDYPPPPTNPGWNPPPLSGGYPPPISQQPLPGGWMSAPREPPINCPPGLEYLAAIDQLLVHQMIEIAEVMTGFETENKFTVKNSLGQKVFYAAERSDCCTRNCCTGIRPFSMAVLDNFEREVIHLERPFACTGCCCFCCLQSMEVYAPPGTKVGSVEQEWAVTESLFGIKNAAGDTVLKIRGPASCFAYSLGADVNFDVLDKDGKAVVGRISKQWSGLVQELLTDADNFGITFPMDLDVRMKAVMLGACFLIDAMFFERKNQGVEARSYRRRYR